MGFVVNTALAFCVLLIPLGGIVAAAAPVPDQPALVITSPWKKTENLFETVGAKEVLSARALPGRIAVFSKTALQKARSTPDVWLILDSKRLSALCGGLL